MGPTIHRAVSVTRMTHSTVRQQVLSNLPDIRHPKDFILLFSCPQCPVWMLSTRGPWERGCLTETIHSDTTVVFWEGTGATCMLFPNNKSPFMGTWFHASLDSAFHCLDTWKLHSSIHSLVHPLGNINWFLLMSDIFPAPCYPTR